MYSYDYIRIAASLILENTIWLFSSSPLTKLSVISFISVNIWRDKWEKLSVEEAKTQ